MSKNTLPVYKGDSKEANAEAVRKVRKLGNKAKDNKKPGFSAAELLNLEVEEIPCLVEPIFHKVGLASLAGSSDVGKSSLLRQLAVAIATGQRDFLGWPIKADHNRVLYVSTEDDHHAIAFLLGKMNKAWNMETERFDGLRFLFETHDILKQIDQCLTEEPADLVIVDAFTDLYGRNMNESNQVRTFLNEYGQVAQKHQCLVLFLHHTGKRTEREAPSKHHLLGSQAFEAKMRLVIEMRADPQESDIRHLCIVKGNYLPGDFKQDSYALEFDGEYMLFANTGERKAFTQLISADSQDEMQDKYERAMDLKEMGWSYEQIAKELGYSSKGSVSKLISRFSPKVSQPVSKGNAGNAQGNDKVNRQETAPF